MGEYIYNMESSSNILRIVPQTIAGAPLPPTVERVTITNEDHHKGVCEQTRRKPR